MRHSHAATFRRLSLPAGACRGALLVAAGLVLAGPGPAFGQTATVPPGVEAVERAPLRPVSDPDKEIRPFRLTASQMVGREVRGRWNERVGDIVAVLERTDGNPVAVAIEVSDYADANRAVVLPLEQLIDQTGFSMITLSAEQLEALPRWDR